MEAKKEYRDSDSYAQTKNNADFSLVSLLLNKISDKRDKLIIRLFAETGCTSHEIVNLKYQDINFQNNSIVVRAENTRNKESRTISISKGLSLELEQFGDKSKAYFFSSVKSPRLRTRSVRKIFDKYSKVLGEKITSSSVRKAHLLKSIGSNKPTENIKKFFGIKRLETKEYLSKKEFYKIRNTVKDERDQLIFDILFETGCKLNELVNIKFSDVEFTTNSIKFETEKQRSAPISEKLSLQIRAYAEERRLSGQDFLFSTRQSKTISDKRAFQIIKEYSIRTGFKEVNPQVLRNTHIACAFSSGESIANISKHTGIENLHNIGIYGSLMAGKND
jgi:integrase